MEKIKLYGYSTSPFVRKIGCGLYYKGIPFEFVPVNPVYNKEIEFTEQRTVPVLQVGDEWRLDSTEQAKWLDDLSSEKPLCGQSNEERELILKLDEWVNDHLIHSAFKSVHDKNSSRSASSSYRHVAWRLANIVSSQTPLDDEIRNAWPELLKMAPFIKRIAKESEELEKEEPMEPKEYLLKNLENGLFLGGLSSPSIADFAAYQHFVFNYLVGITDELGVRQEPQLWAWLTRVASHLPENAMLVPDYIIVNKLAD